MKVNGSSSVRVTFQKVSSLSFPLKPPWGRRGKCIFLQGLLLRCCFLWLFFFVASFRGRVRGPIFGWMSNGVYGTLLFRNTLKNVDLTRKMQSEERVLGRVNEILSCKFSFHGNMTKRLRSCLPGCATQIFHTRPRQKRPKKAFELREKENN